MPCGVKRPIWVSSPLGSGTVASSMVYCNEGSEAASLPRLFFVWDTTRQLLSSSRAKANTERGTSVNAFDSDTAMIGSVWAPLLWCAIPSTTLPVRSAILTRGSSILRTSRDRDALSPSPRRDMSGSTTTSATSFAVMASSRAVLSRGRLMVTSSPKASCTCTRPTLDRSAPAAMRRGTRVYSHESSTATYSTFRAWPRYAPGRVPRVICAASQIPKDDLPVPSRPAARDREPTGIRPSPSCSQAQRTALGVMVSAHVTRNCRASSSSMKGEVSLMLLPPLHEGGRARGPPAP